jgi:cysteine-rich repeat protein
MNTTRLARRMGSHGNFTGVAMGTTFVLALAGCSSQIDSSPISSQKQALGSSGGQIFLSGDDADDVSHCNGAACGGLFINLLDEALDASKTGPQAVPNAAKKVLTIGVNAGQSAVGFNSWNNPANCAPVTGKCGPNALVTNLTTAAQIAAVVFSDYNVIFLPSDEVNTAGGIEATQVAALNARSADIQTFINDEGGSLIALTEQNVAGGWGWLPVPLTTALDSFTDAAPDPDLAAISPGTTQANLTHCCFHNVFTGSVGQPGFYSGLKVLAHKIAGGATPGNPSLVGLPVLLGGAKITAEICNNGQDDDLDGQVDLGDPDCQFCGNGVKEAGEDCDDGGNANGDGCDKDCKLENHAPVAKCHDRVINAVATCGGSADINDGSSDPDGNLVTCTQNVTSFNTVGATTVTLTCTDGIVMASCTATVTVVDTTPPSVICAADQSIECTSGGAVATVSAVALDNCSAVAAACVPPSGSTFPIGTTTGTCSATDASGNTGTCNYHLTVRDTVAPSVTATGAAALWPANHKAKTVSLADCGITIVDQCQGPLTLGAASAAITCVTSDEPKNSAGDGNTASDMVIVNATTVNLLAERQGTSDGRVYTIQFMTSDGAGNTSVGSCKVTVPHDQSPAGAAIDSGVKYTVGTCR